jgi:hypothetical protein
MLFKELIALHTENHLNKTQNAQLLIGKASDTFPNRLYRMSSGTPYRNTS